MQIFGSFGPHWRTVNIAQQVWLHIQQYGPGSRAELARHLRRSKPATSAAIDTLLQQDLLLELGQGRSTLGRPPKLVNLNHRSRLVVGAEVDVHELRLGLGDLRGDLLEQRSVPWRGGEASGELGPALKRAIDALCGPQGQVPRALALGLPGVVRDGVVSHAPNLPELEDPATLTRLRSELSFPVLLYNDVNLAAVSEARPGELLAFVSIGSGFGVGITQGRELLDGHQGRAGELGYLPGAGGENLGQLLSETGLARLLGLQATQLVPLLAGRSPAMLERAAMRPFLSALLSALQVLTLTLDPARIVIGGRIGSKLLAQLPSLQRQLQESLPFAPQLCISQFPDSAVVQGAVQMAAARASADLLEELSDRARPHQSAHA
ncbi:ROK family protein [Deinococcus detaillensis]|uniref:ROK family protein n=1 Tax=Deinococcus detaillensis TaxID=2592048 RepID=A0A553UFQ1_9DEIO|nr:ROK family protein [Deinococcus detaillensis]